VPAVVDVLTAHVPDKAGTTVAVVAATLGTTATLASFGQLFVSAEPESVGAASSPAAGWPVSSVAVAAVVPFAAVSSSFL